jgi:hypothetical protein
MELHRGVMRAGNSGPVVTHGRKLSNQTKRRKLSKRARFYKNLEMKSA